DGRAVAVPILMRQVDWQETAIQRLTVIPKNLVPVTSWDNIDEALTEITKEIKRVIDEVAATPQLNGNLLSVPSPACSDGTFRCRIEVDRPTALRSTGLTELLPDVVLRFEGDPGARRIADI